MGERAPDGGERLPRDEVLRLKAENGWTATETAKRTGYKAGTIRAWESLRRKRSGKAHSAAKGAAGGKGRKKRGGKGISPPPDEGPRARGLATADELDPDDRAAMVQQGRDLLSTADRLRAKVDRMLESDDVDPAALARLTGAIANTMRAFNDLLRGVPGLMAEIKRSQGDDDADAEAARIEAYLKGDKE